MSLERLIIVICGGLSLVTLGRHVAQQKWWWLVVDLVVLAFLAYLYVRQEEREIRQGHRTTAANCKFWTGDNGEVDWGTCIPCQEEARHESAR